VPVATAKWNSTETQVYLIDRCLQLHGGYGYMRKYPVARAYLHSGEQTIYRGRRRSSGQVWASKATRFGAAQGQIRSFYAAAGIFSSTMGVLLGY
jgi:alkylation response protein AidB-like acyl-CoA dehydrogenase